MEKSSADSKTLPARDIEEQASAWIEQRDFGSWTSTDEAALEAWLSESLHRRVTFDRLDLGWRRADRLTALRASRGSMRDLPSEGSRPTKMVQFGALGAAAVAVLAGWLYFSADRQFAYATSVGGREVVRLIDGSQIELNTDTAVRILDRRDRREVWLDRGEAYFQVTHDAAHPFVVNVGRVRLTDLGTKFVLRRYHDRLKVAVSEGGVRLETASSGSHDITLRKGDVAISTPSGLSITRETQVTLANDLSWRTGILVFHHSRLIDAASEFNRYNHKQIVITDPEVADLEIGGTFPTTDVEGFVALTKDVLRLRVKTEGNEVRVSH